MQYVLISPDFSLINQQVVITATNPEPCIRFTALADNLGLEGQEMFTLSLSRSGRHVTFVISSVNVLIDDGDGT